MSVLIATHVVTGLTGIVFGSIAIAEIIRRRRLEWVDRTFLVMTAASCATGFVFLPTDGVTSAQLVSFFIVLLLAVAAGARYVGRLNGGWNQVYALAAVGVLFLDILITIAQSFLHVPVLRAIAPTQNSPVFIAVKLLLLVTFIAIAVVAARRAGRS